MKAETEGRVYVTGGTRREMNRPDMRGNQYIGEGDGRWERRRVIQETTSEDKIGIGVSYAYVYAWVYAYGYGLCL